MMKYMQFDEVAGKSVELCSWQCTNILYFLSHNTSMPKAICPGIDVLQITLLYPPLFIHSVINVFFVYGLGASGELRKNTGHTPGAGTLTPSVLPLTSESAPK